MLAVPPRSLSVKKVGAKIADREQCQEPGTGLNGKRNKRQK